MLGKMIKNGGYYNFKKLSIIPKRKYVYITFDDKQTIVTEKNRFSLDMSINFACMCKDPIREELGQANRCKICGRTIC